MLKSVSCLGVVLFCGGCATLPTEWRQEGIDVKALALAIQCEFAAGYSQAHNFAALDKFAAAVDLDLKVTTNFNGAASASLTIPVPPDTLNAGLGASYDETATRDAKLSFFVRFDELKYKFVVGHGKSRQLIPDCLRGDTGFPPASATLGIANWVSDSVNAVGDDTDAAEFSSSGYLLNFNLYRKADGSVGVVSSRVKESKLGIGGSKRLENQINIAVTAIKDYVAWTPPLTVAGRVAKVSSAKERVNGTTRDHLKFQLLKNLIDSGVTQTGSRTSNITILAQPPSY